MADFNTGSVLQAYDGELFAAPVGTTVPTDREAALDTAFVSVGWITEDGLVFNPNLTSEDAIKGWPRGETLLKPTATLEPTFTFAMAQHDGDTLDWVVQPSVSRMLVLDYKATATSAPHRLILPQTKVSTAGEMAFNTSDLISTEIEVTCERSDDAGYTFCFLIPDAAGTGTTEKAY